jgi:hypothetical protein
VWAVPTQALNPKMPTDIALIRTLAAVFSTACGLISIP